MADVRLDQENVLSDYDYLLAVKGNDVVRISKKDQATVAGGLIKESYLSDLNNLPKEGFSVSYFDRESLNKPFDGSGACVTFPLQSGVRLQLAYRGDAQEIAFRVFWANKWEDEWFKVNGSLVSPL